MATTMQGPGTGALEAVTGGASAEVVGGIAAVVLSILGLANVAPGLMVSIASIVIGAALVLEGAIIAAEYSRLLTTATAAPQPGVVVPRASEFSGGLTIEFLAGLTGVVLGVLALLGIDQAVLMAVAVIVFGSALVLSSGVVSRLTDLRVEAAGMVGSTQAVAHEAVAAASGAQVFTGLGSIVLGILALVGIQTTTLTLVALLAVATTILLSGSAIGGKMFSLLKSE